MHNRIARRALIMALAAGALASAAAAPATELVFDQPQTAGICGYRPMWDTPVITAENGVTEVQDDQIKDRRLTAPWSPLKRSTGTQPGGLVFDAIHRSLLVRFPGAAEKIAAEFDQSQVITKVELVLPFLDNELWPEGITTMGGRPPEYGYFYRPNWGAAELYRAQDPNWHAVAWALRRPWQADRDLGPTYNAFINGAGYWAHFGAQDPERDRFPRQFGPAEVSAKHPEGRIDVTALVADSAFGATAAERLRTLTDCGFLVRKLETYDHRYYQGAYEWATGTGGHGLRIRTPKLVVTFGPAKDIMPRPFRVAPAADIAKLAAELKGGKGGKPTAVMPTNDELTALAAKFGLRQPAWMPDWQWQKVQELRRISARDPGDVPFWFDYVEPIARRNSSDPLVVYQAWVDQILTRPYRGWNGFEAAGDTLFWNLYKDAMPAPAQEHIRNFWTAWLEPDRATGEFDHPQAMQLWYGNKNKYYEETGDWRGNTSFYRDGYCGVISTMNFNHTAALGALLGGGIIGSQNAMADGRHGLEYFPLRLWTWYDGTAQESIDHYYYAITLNAQKTFADFGPTELDRMMGRSCLAKSIDELAAAYHPALRHFIGVSGRTCVPQYLLATQDGLQYILHALSKKGTLHDVNNPDLPVHAPVIGTESGPRQVALESVTGPWGPDLIANLVDDKPIPFEMTTTFKQWGTHLLYPLWRRVYLGHNYGLASGDAHGGIVQAMAQWRRGTEPVAKLQELGTMNIRFGINTTPLVNAAPGWMEAQGQQAILQHRNKLLLVASPYRMSGREGVRSLQDTIAFYNYEAPQATWEIFCDGKKLGALPQKVKAGQRLTIRDGVTFIGVIPLPATNLGRTDEVVLEEGTPQTYANLTTKPALVINNYNLQRDTPLPKDADWTPLDRAYGGFVVEFGDVTEYKDFAAFQAHLAEAKLDLNWQPEQTAVAVRYASGKDTLEMTVKTDYAGGDRPATECFVERKVNGVWPYLAPGLDRDSNVTQMGTTGRLEKGGAVLACEPGIMGYLQAEPLSGTFAGFNPLPDPTLWSLAVPGGVTVTTDGRVGLLRVMVRPKERKLWVDYAIKADQKTPDMATALLVTGWDAAPIVERNGTPFAGQLATLTIDGRKAFVVPLFADGAGAVPKDLAARAERAQKLFATLAGREEKPVFVQDWYVAGPFYNDFLGKGFKKNSYPPEQTPGAVDLAATYPSTVQQDNKDVKLTVAWKRLLAAGQPALGATPVNLLKHVTPGKGVSAFLYTKIVSDRERRVTLYTGSDEFMTVWMNGQQVARNPYYRAALKDQDKNPVTLKAGENVVLVKLAHGWEGWNYFFRLGDEFGFPVTDGITVGFGAMK